MKAKKTKYREGQWVAVPLRCGGYALGLMARWAPRTHGAMGYFFGQRYGEVPSEYDTLVKAPDDAVLIAWFSDLGIVGGDWPLVETRRSWGREEWPMPRFGRIDAIGKKAWVVEYADSGILRTLMTTPTTIEEARKLPHDGVWGAQAIENRLSSLLCPK